MEAKSIAKPYARPWDQPWYSNDERWASAEFSNWEKRSSFGFRVCLVLLGFLKDSVLCLHFFSLEHLSSSLTGQRKGLCTTCKTPFQRSLCIIKRLWKRDWCCSLSILRKVEGQSYPCLVHAFTTGPDIQSWKRGCAMSTSAFTAFSGLFCGNCIDKKNSPQDFYVALDW